MASRASVVFLVLLALASTCTEIKGSRLKGLKLEKQLEPTIKTIKTEHGDIYDCIDMDKQPAFDHPILKDHKIQMEPSKELKDMLAGSKPKNYMQPGAKRAKIGLKERCPPRTVPIRRMTQEHLTRASSTSQKLRFHSEEWKHGLEFAGILTTKTPEKKYIGAEANINIWNPSVEPHQFSSALIALESGEDAPQSQIQVGWTVNPELNGDSKTRMYAAWSNDNFVSTGCFNIRCPGFVQTGRIAVDSLLLNISTYGGDQFELRFSVILDPQPQVWWFMVAEDREAIGYWPVSLFTNSLHDAAKRVRWGGHVYTPLSDKVSPPMGSGHFENGWFGRTCYMDRVTIKDETFSTIPPDNSFIQNAESRCYLEGDNYYKNDSMEYRFFFGGTGGKDGTTCLS